jgi:hypothetical protein
MAESPTDLQLAESADVSRPMSDLNNVATLNNASTNLETEAPEIGPSSSALAPASGGLTSSAQPLKPTVPLHSKIAEGIIHAFAGTDGSAGSALKSALAGGLAGLAAASRANFKPGSAALGGLGVGATAAVQQANEQRERQTAQQMEKTRQDYLNAETQARTVADQRTANRLDEEATQKRVDAGKAVAAAYGNHRTAIGTDLTAEEIYPEAQEGGKYDHTKVTAIPTGTKTVFENGQEHTVPTFTLYPRTAGDVTVTPEVAGVLKEGGYNYPEGTKINGDLLDSLTTKSMAAQTSGALLKKAAAEAKLSEDATNAALEKKSDLAAVNPYLGAHPDDPITALGQLSQQKGKDGQFTPAAQSAARLLAGWDPKELEKHRHDVADEQNKALEERNKAREVAIKERASTGDIGSAAELLRKGMEDPSQLSKRSATYQATLDEADKQEMAETGKHFNIAQAQTDYKFANQPATQNTLKYLNSLTGGQDPTKGNLAELENQSNRINRTSFPPLNKAEAWAKLESGDPGIVAYRTVVTEVADQVAKILQGGGTGAGTSDAKLRQAQELFDTGFSKQQIQAVIAELRPLLNNRRDSLIGDNRYLQNQFGKPNAQQPPPVYASAPGKPRMMSTDGGKTWQQAPPQ